MTVLYRNLCNNKMCCKEPVLYMRRIPLSHRLTHAYSIGFFLDHDIIFHFLFLDIIEKNSRKIK